MRLEEKIISKVRPYTDRAERAGFIAESFGWAIREPLLDVGSGQQHLKKVLTQGFAYTGIDVTDEADVHFNLDSGTIPFEAGSFETVVCADTLEHLENIHFVLTELFRLSRRWVILSLPNCWCDMKFLMAGRGRGSGKFYGLPLQKPPDRHRWFFNYSEARSFLLSSAEGLASNVWLYRYYGLKGHSFYLANLMLPKALFDELFVNTLWAVFEK